MHRILRLKIVVVLATIGVLFGVVAPAGALSDNPTLEEELRAIRRSNRAPTVVDGDVDSKPDVRPDVRPDDVRPDVRPDRPMEVLKLECERLEDVDGKAAGCRWSASDDARGYQLWVIVNRGARELVGTYGAETLGAKDRLPEDTLVARYAVVALDNAGEIIGRSRIETVRFRQDPPAIDVLKIECEKIRSDAGKAAACHWSDSDQARAYQLWRLVNRGERELVGTFNNETFSARDALPNNTRVVRYAVLALDSDGEIVGRSRVATLEFPTVRPVDVEPVDIKPVDVRPVDVKPIDPPAEKPPVKIDAVRTDAASVKTAERAG